MHARPRPCACVRPFSMGGHEHGSGHAAIDGGGVDMVFEGEGKQPWKAGAGLYKIYIIVTPHEKMADMSSSCSSNF